MEPCLRPCTTSSAICPHQHNQSLAQISDHTSSSTHTLNLRWEKASGYGESDNGSMGERVSTRVSTRGYRQGGHDLRCNALLLSMILWWLCSKARATRGDERAQIRWKLWLREKVILMVWARLIEVMLVVVEIVSTLRSGLEGYCTVQDCVLIWVFRLDSGLACFERRFGRECDLET